MSYGDKLRQLRLENNMTQEQLSKILNVSRATVGRYETNERFPDKDTLKKIADYFSVSIDFLLERTIEKDGFSHTANNIFESSEKYVAYKEIDQEIASRLIDEKIINEGQLIPKSFLDKIIKFGIEAAVEILKLEKNINK